MTVIGHLERSNIHHLKTNIIFNFPIKVSTEESALRRSACIPLKQGREQIPPRTSPIHSHRLLRCPQLWPRSVGSFIRLKILKLRIVLYENKILVSRLPKPDKLNAILFSSTPIQVVPHFAALVTSSLEIHFRLQPHYLVLSLGTSVLIFSWDHNSFADLSLQMLLLSLCSLFPLVCQGGRA